MATVAGIMDFLGEFAPPQLAADWDNVGLLVGDSAGKVRRVMTCLTVTPASAAEAVREKADLIVTHHPLPFRPLKRLTTDTPTGRMLLDLIAAKVAVYSPHTSFDSAREGINQRLAAGLKLRDVVPLVPESYEDETLADLGSGRCGDLTKAAPLSTFARRLKRFLGIGKLQWVGQEDQTVRRVAVACGSAGDFLSAAHAAGCDCFITGEARFHTCLEAEAEGIGLLLPGHYASERFALEHLADVLREKFPQLEIWPSQDEADPVKWL